MKKTISILLAIALVCTLLGTMAFAGSGKHGGDLKCRMINDPPKLDPAMATDTTSSRVILTIFDMLVDNDPDGKGLVPRLAESWESSDAGRVWTFHLRKGVHFQKESLGKPTENKGREVKAADWKYSFERMIRINSPRSYFIDMVKGYKDFVGYCKITAMNEDKKAEYIKALDMLIASSPADIKKQAETWKKQSNTTEWAGIKVIDDYTLQFELDYPFAPFASILAYNSFMVIPHEDAEKWGKDFNFHPVGSGPFILDKWEHDQKVVLKRNPDYWGKSNDGKQLPFLDSVTFVIIPDNTIAYQEFKKGNIDFFIDIPDEYYEEVKKEMPKLIQERPWVGTYYYGFNNSKPPFKDNKKLRQAFNYAVNRDLISELVVLGRYPAGKGVLPPGMPGYNPDLKGYSFDPVKAKKMMAEAGYPDGIEIELQVNNNPRHRAVAEAVQAQLMELGIKLNIKILDWGVHLDTCERAETQLFRMGWVVDYMDPDNFLYVLLDSKNHGPKGNYSFYTNPEVDKLLEEARIETSWDKRMELYRSAEEIIVEDAPWIFLFHYSTSFLAQPWVKDIYLPAMGDFQTNLTRVYIEK